MNHDAFSFTSSSTPSSTSSTTPTTTIKKVTHMRVVKRNGSLQEVSFDKVIARIRLLCEMNPPLPDIDPISIAQKVCAHIYDGVNTSELDELAAEMCTQRSVDHLEYGMLASRIIISNNQKLTSPSFSETITLLYNHYDTHQKHTPLVSKEVYDFVLMYKNKLNDYIDYSRDYQYDYFAFKTLEKAYLMRVNGKIIERIQHLFMRVSIGLHHDSDSIKKTLETYDLMSKKFFTHATPTLFHSGTPNPQLLSCFLLGVEDSVEGMYKAIGDCAMISKWAGGIGLHLHDIRGENSTIRSTNGKSGGLVPMLKVFNDVARHINQSGKRNGSFAMYLEPHHPDILGFLDAKKNHGDENARARDLFYAMWVSDLFMERVKQKKMWSLFCPDQCRGLSEAYGDKYRELYEEYEANPSNIIKQLPAVDLWKEIVKSQMETGTPYVCFKDAANQKSNQQHIGTIKSSNLCVAPETMILTDCGYQTISALKDQTVNVWNGEEFSEAKVIQTGTQQPMMKVCLNTGAALCCTSYHKFWIDTEHTIVQLSAAELRPGMKLVNAEFPVIQSPAGIDADPYAYENGFQACGSNDWKIPLYQSSLVTRLDWLAGFCDYHAYLRNQGEFMIIEGTHHEEKMRHVHLLLQTLGVSAVLTFNPTLYHWIITMTTLDIVHLLGLGWAPKRLELSPTYQKRNPTSSVQMIVTSVEDAKRKCDTFCFYEPLKQSGVFNGMLTKNCSEIIEYSDDKEYACCTLASISLPAYIKEFDWSTVKTITLYSRSNCRFCELSKTFLASYGVAHLIEEIQLNDADERGTFFEKLNDCQGDHCSVHSVKFRTVPQIYINGEHIGGFTELYRYAKPTFDYEKLMQVTKVIVTNLDKIVDLNYYPVKETRLSNLRHRPLGIGVQGLADVYAKFHVAFDSAEAKALNQSIFAAIYYASCEQSCILSQEHKERIMQLSDSDKTEIQRDNWDVVRTSRVFREELDSSVLGSYSTFEGSPISKGRFQFDLWKAQPLRQVNAELVLDWDLLRKEIQTHGMRNSLLVAPMPTASTSQILGNNECIEPFTSNIYSRGTLAGQFLIVNKYLLEDLSRLKLWSNDLKEQILICNGSIQSIKNIPEVIRETYKIAWDLSMRDLIDQAADRGIYVCQSQSLNLWIEDPEVNKLTSMLFYAWSKGLKTGVYYLRRRAVSKAQNFTIDPKKEKDFLKAQELNEPSCLNCSA